MACRLEAYTLGKAEEEAAICKSAEQVWGSFEKGMFAEKANLLDTSDAFTHD